MQWGYLLNRMTTVSETESIQSDIIKKMIALHLDILVIGWHGYSLKSTEKSEKKALNIRNIQMQLFEYSNIIWALEMAKYEYE